MRVTSTMKDYIYKCVEKKVADQLDAAEKAKKDQVEKDQKALKAVKEYAESLIPEASKKVVAFAKKQGLTWFDHVPSWHGINENVNVAFSVNVDSSDFEETNIIVNALSKDLEPADIPPEVFALACSKAKDCPMMKGGVV